MDNQYNNQQPQVMLLSMEEMRGRRKTAFGTMCDKIAEFFDTNGILRTFARGSDIMSYIITFLCLLMTILNMAINGSKGSMVFDITALIFGFLALSRKTALPLALALSQMSVFTIINIILKIIAMAGDKYAEAGAVVMFVFNIIFQFIELTLMIIFASAAWSAFAVMLEPKQYSQPVYSQPSQQYQQPMAPQAPVQQYQQPAAPQAPVQQYQQPMAPQAPAQPIQPIAPAQSAQPETSPNDWTCTCGTVNPPVAHFCLNCGKPKG